MKVVMLASTYPRFPGDGSGRFVQSLAEAVSDSGHEVHVLAPHHPSQAPLGGPVHVHHFRYIWPDSAAMMGYAGAMTSDRRLRAPAYALVVPYIVFGALALQRLMARHHFDVLHAHWVLPGGLMALPLATLGRLPLVVSLHGSDIFVAQRNRLFSGVARQVFAHAQAVTACSGELSAAAARLGAPTGATHLIPWGADPGVFTRAVDVEGIRQRWGLTAHERIVVTVGRLVGKKGYAYLVRALPAMVRAIGAVRLLIAGDGPERTPLEKLAAEIGVRDNIVFAGQVSWDAVPAYLNVGEVFVVPSVHEEGGNVDGLPTTILEAMAAGKPVVASRVAGIPLVVKDSETGILVEEGQPDQLAEALIRLLTDPELALRLGRAARQCVETELNWAQIARRFVRLYELARHDRRPSSGA